MTQLDYKYRPDGMFLVRRECSSCGESFDRIAVAQWSDLCDACRQVKEWEQKS